MKVSYLVANPRTPLDRQQNKETLELAKKIRFERGQQLLEDMEADFSFDRSSEEYAMLYLWML